MVYSITLGNGVILMYSVIVIEFQEFMEAFGQMGRTFFQTKRLDEESYRRNIKDEYIIVRPPVPGPLSAYTYDIVSTVYIIYCTMQYYCGASDRNHDISHRLRIHCSKVVQVMMISTL